MNPSPSSLLIVGPSTRAAAFSALRAGLQPRCADCFADRDLQKRCPAVKIGTDYPGAFAKLIDAATPGPWMYTGGLENWPSLIARWQHLRPLWGNDAHTLQLARDHARVAQVVRAAGLPAPLTLDSPPADASRKWLTKLRRGSTGHGISEWDTNSSEPSGHKKVYWQEYLDGQPAAAAYAGHADGACFLGLTHQLVGVPWLFADRFQYCGSLGPIAPTPVLLSQLTDLGQVLVTTCGLRGLFGVDGILRDGSFWPVEINPRYTASMEILEYATHIQTLAWQRFAFQPGEQPPPPPSTPEQFVGKAILFAPQDVIFPQEGMWLSALATAAPVEELPAFADIPAPGEAIARGNPILTLFVQKPTLLLAQDALRPLADELLRWLCPHPTGD